MFEKKRCHCTYVFELFFRHIVTLIAVLATACLSILGDMATDEELMNDLPFGKIVAVVSALVIMFGGIMMLYCVFKWRHTYISLEGDVLNYQSGKFIKKRVTIPFEKINTIDMGRNVFEKLVGTCRLKIDTGAYSNAQEKNHSEMDLVFDLKEAHDIRSYILARSGFYDGSSAISEQIHDWDAVGKPQWAVRAGAGDFILYGLTSSSVWTFFWLLVLGVCFIAEISEKVLGQAAEAAFPLLRVILAEIERQGALRAVLAVIMGYLAISLALNIFTVLWASVRFFGFRVARQGGNIMVRYGLFTEKNYTLQVRNIHALIVKQNLFQQIIGRCSVEAVCMGFGDEMTETAILFPIIRKKRIDDVLSMVLPEYITEMHIRRRRISGIIFHALMPTLICCAVCLVIYKTCGCFMGSMLLIKLGCAAAMALVFVRGVLSYFNATLDWNDRVVSVQSGGFTKILYRIRTDAVQEIQVKTNPIKDMFGIGTYLVHYHGPRFNNTSVSDNISSDYFAELSNILEDS